MEKKAIDIIRETIKVDNDGNLSFRIDAGRGRGRAIKIPADQVDQFVEVVKEKTNER